MAKWGYGNCHGLGPDCWEKEFPSACGKRQSPINIISSNAKYDSELSVNKLKFSFDAVHSKCQTLHFTGHNFKVETSPESMILTGAPGFEGDQFKLVQYHFHWGCSVNENGSEHQIDGKSWPSELHLVHYNATRYEKFEEACCKPDGLLVLGVLIEFGTHHSELQNLVKSLDNIRDVKCVELNEQRSSVSLKQLLPQNTERYYTYSGSLTTPPCFESVTWVVFERPITMSQDQIVQFLKVHDDDCGTCHNFRPVCPLYDRQVKKSFI